MSAKMGDRVYMTVWVRRQDLTLFVQHMEGSTKEYSTAEALERADIQGETPVAYEVVEEQANYGMTSQREEAAKAGCIFSGSHCAGGEFTGFQFYSDGKEQHEWPGDHLGSGFLAQSGSKEEFEAIALFKAGMEYIDWQLGLLAKEAEWCDVCFGRGTVSDGTNPWQVCPTGCGCGEES